MKPNVQKLADILLKIKSKDEMINFLYGLLTPKEIEELSTRLDIVKMLKQNMPQKKIAKKLGVGIATVTRGSTEIKKGHFTTIKPSLWRAS